PTTFPFPQGYWLGFGVQTSPEIKEYVLIKVPDSIQNPIRLNAEIKAILQAPEREPEEAPTAEEPAPTPKTPTPKTPTPKKPTPEEPGVTDGVCEPPEGVLCYEGWDYEKCQCAGPETTVPPEEEEEEEEPAVPEEVETCSLCSPYTTAEICVNSVGDIVGEAKCFPPGTGILITNTNTGQTYSATANFEGSVLVTATDARPMDVLSIKITSMPPGGPTDITTSASPAPLTDT
ncbi:hypothetical protein KY335_03270, partial [Candidatus Woesearchaeota archaeon]|nr:hypothetical protein [Candidatus Woesearchaeota archaeon]